MRILLGGRSRLRRKLTLNWLHFPEQTCCTTQQLQPRLPGLGWLGPWLAECCVDWRAGLATWRFGPCHWRAGLAMCWHTFGHTTT
jgi:hypothetical protein